MMELDTACDHINELPVGNALKLEIFSDDGKTPMIANMITGVDYDSLTAPKRIMIRLLVGQELVTPDLLYVMEIAILRDKGEIYVYRCGEESQLRRRCSYEVGRDAVETVSEVFTYERWSGKAVITDLDHYRGSVTLYVYLNTRKYPLHAFYHTHKNLKVGDVVYYKESDFAPFCECVGDGVSPDGFLNWGWK